MEMFVSISVNAISVRGTMWSVRSFWAEKQGKWSQIVLCTCCVQRMAEMLRCRDGQNAKSHHSKWVKEGRQSISLLSKNVYFGRMEKIFFSEATGTSWNDNLQQIDHFLWKAFLWLLFQILVLHGLVLTFWSIQINSVFSKLIIYCHF